MQILVDGYLAEVEQTVRNVLGSRVRSVLSELQVNSDEARILRVRIVYDPDQRPSVDEMESTVDAVWSVEGVDGVTFPVIDFKAEVDPEAVAAE